WGCRSLFVSCVGWGMRYGEQRPQLAHEGSGAAALRSAERGGELLHELPDDVDPPLRDLGSRAGQGQLDGSRVGGIGCALDEAGGLERPDQLRDVDGLEPRVIGEPALAR